LSVSGESTREDFDQGKIGGHKKKGCHWKQLFFHTKEAGHWGRGRGFRDQDNCVGGRSSVKAPEKTNNKKMERKKTGFRLSSEKKGGGLEVG